MKNLSVALIALLGTAAVSAQDLNPADVPQDLRDTFEQAHPNASDVEWEREGDSYKVEFEVDYQDQEVWYSADGQTNKMEKDIKEDELPQAISSAISDKYADYKVDSIEMTEENGKTTYEVELEKGWDDEINVVFDADGKVLNEWKD
ncbi:PepSY-like domain-containing protein [Pricia sp. S334]|uniref:PepSY-like domain-containing protein n=1 Tax=Pricia mediterranea TaxID=3076079 RepID=A0ABU3L1C6_9FLAO|nr:PepSY-like domain-containing protein [Pricia sp. S334]MDT7827512.1 PepSY-like domain-containing protein [Pricia sp. S334]